MGLCFAVTQRFALFKGIYQVLHSTCWWWSRDHNAPPLRRRRFDNMSKSCTPDLYQKQSSSFTDKLSFATAYLPLPGQLNNDGNLHATKTFKWTKGLKWWEITWNNSRLGKIKKRVLILVIESATGACWDLRLRCFSQTYHMLLMCSKRNLYSAVYHFKLLNYLPWLLDGRGGDNINYTMQWHRLS